MRSHVVRRAALAVAVGATWLAVPGLPARAQDASPRQSHRDREGERSRPRHQELTYDEQVEEGRSFRLQRQRRYAQDRYRQDYRNRLQERRRERSGWRPDDYASDGYFDAPASLRYAHDGRWYETNAYGADALRDAANSGYEEGFRSGQADREDGWSRGGYRDSFAYQDADQAYEGRSLAPAQHAHYFREGVRRGYEDGFDDSRRYGRTEDGHYLLLSTVLAGLLTFEPLR
jgi:hypothetical protein